MFFLNCLSEIQSEKIIEKHRGKITGLGVGDLGVGLRDSSHVFNDADNLHACWPYARSGMGQGVT